MNQHKRKRLIIGWITSLGTTWYTAVNHVVPVIKLLVASIADPMRSA